MTFSLFYHIMFVAYVYHVQAKFIDLSKKYNII